MHLRLLHIHLYIHTCTYAHSCAHTCTDVNVAFQQAMLKVGMESEDLPRQFTLTVDEPCPLSDARRPPGGGAMGGEEVEPAGLNAWSLLGLSHTVNWPLHILFTPAVLEK